jgi:Putative mono-oxygenase ydhR
MRGRGGFPSVSGRQNPPTKGADVRIRIVTFSLDLPADDYISHAANVAPAFRSWPGLLAKWWIGDAASGTYGGVYLFATRSDADRSRDTDLFREMNTNPAFKDLTVREYDLLDAPTTITAPYPAGSKEGAVTTISEPTSPARETHPAISEGLLERMRCVSLPPVRSRVR